MNMKMQQNLAKKTTALLSAVAASSLLGLPALAQMTPNSNQNTQPNSSQNSSECVPIVSQSGTPSSTLGSAADASQPGVRSFPNQADPRAGAILPGTNQSSIGGPVDNQSQSNAQTIDYNSRSQAYNNSSNGQFSSYGNQSNRSGDVLSFGGSTNGGHAREIVEAASDRNMNDRYSFDSVYGSTARNNNNDTRYGNMQASAAQDPSMGTSGGAVNERAQGNVSSSSSMNDRMMSNTTTGSSSMSSSAMSSSTSSSADTQISDRCGPGMMLRNSSDSGQFQDRQNQFQNRSTSEPRDYQR